MTGDGKKDIVFAGSYNTGPSTSTKYVVGTLVNKGGEEFTLSAETPLDTYPLTMDVSDFNRDKKPDVVTATIRSGVSVDRTEGSISLHLGNGKGEYLKKSTTEVGDSRILFVKAGDLNGDGKADVVLASEGQVGRESTSKISLLFGNGDGTLRPAVNKVNEIDLTAFEMGDLNKDGRPDLVTTHRNHRTDGHTISVWLNKGDGTFPSPVTYAIGNYSHPYDRYIALRDFNKDGAPELFLLQGTNDSNPGYLPNKGNGTFGPVVDLETGTSNMSVFTLMDIGGDGDFDLVTRMYDNLLVYPNRGGAGLAAMPDRYTLHPTGGKMKAGDLNGDGEEDLVIVSAHRMSYPTVLFSRRNTVPPPLPEFAPSLEMSAKDVAFNTNLWSGDFNGDGKLDLVMSPVSKGVRVLLGKGDGTFQPGPDTPDMDAPVAAVADFNGDRRPDLLTVLEDRMLVLLNGGDGTFSSRSEYAGGENAHSILIGDFNGDGKTDFAVAGLSSVYQRLTPGSNAVYLNRGNGTFHDPRSFTLRTAPSMVMAADFTSDGKTDLVAGNPGSIDVYKGDGKGSFGLLTSFPNYDSRSDTRVRTGDFNRDGNADFAYFNELTAGVCLGDGKGGFKRIEYSTLPMTYIGDFNNDDRIDVAGGGGFVPGFGDGTFRFTKPETLEPGISIGEAAEQGDYNGDGKLDFAALRLAESGPILRVFLNRSPDLWVTSEKGVAKGGDRVALTVTPMRPVQAAPKVGVSGPCFETHLVEVTPSTIKGSYSGVFVVPAGTTDCTATITALGIRRSDKRSLKDTGSFVVKRSPPTVRVVLDNNDEGLFRDHSERNRFNGPVRGYIEALDEASGVDTIYFSLDNPACTPGNVTDCTTISNPYSPDFRVFTPHPSLPFVATSRGLHTVYIFVKDRIGNVSPLHRFEFFIDPTAPANQR